MDRGDLSDAEWELIGPLLPPERRRWAHPAGDNRRFLNGMFHVLLIGYLWRNMQRRYGKWNSVYVRFPRWAEQSDWDALLQTVVDLGLTDDWQHTIDSSSVAATYPQIAKRGPVKNALGRSCGGLTTKIHAHCRPAGVRSTLSRTASRLHPDRRRSVRLNVSRAARGDLLCRAQGTDGGQGV